MYVKNTFFNSQKLFPDSLVSFYYILSHVLLLQRSKTWQTCLSDLQGFVKLSRILTRGYRNTIQLK